MKERESMLETWNKDGGRWFLPAYVAGWALARASVPVLPPEWDLGPYDLAIRRGHAARIKSRIPIP